jgi:hypothetical protein
MGTQRDMTGTSKRQPLPSGCWSSLCYTISVLCGIVGMGTYLVLYIIYQLFHGQERVTRFGTLDGMLAVNPTLMWVATGFVAGIIVFFVLGKIVDALSKRSNKR